MKARIMSSFAKKWLTKFVHHLYLPSLKKSNTKLLWR